MNKEFGAQPLASPCPDDRISAPAPRRLPTLVVLTVTLRDWTRSVTLHRTRADAMTRLREAFNDGTPQKADDAEFIDELQQDGNLVTFDDAEVPEASPDRALPQPDPAEGTL